MKQLLLFDIDGTLVRGGPAKEAFERALVETYGTTGPIESWDFSGKTDPQIARELLSAAGRTRDEIDAGLPRLWTAYLAGLELGLARRPMDLLPGVTLLLDALAELETAGEVALGLVTGNLARGAELKLASAGLRSTYPVGAFGSDHELRDELPRIALERARQAWGRSFEREQVVIIGDTPRDVQCGRAHGTRTVGVATGRFTRLELEACGADVVLDDFTETEQVLRLFTTEGRAA
jgi:phosphoglycolate phosphatase